MKDSPFPTLGALRWDPCVSAHRAGAALLYPTPRNQLVALAWIGCALAGMAKTAVVGWPWPERRRP